MHEYTNFISTLEQFDGCISINTCSEISQLVADGNTVLDLQIVIGCVFKQHSTTGYKTHSFSKDKDFFCDALPIELYLDLKVFTFIDHLVSETAICLNKLLWK